MSDVGRQDFSDKAGAALKPDSQKTTTEHIGDKLKGTVDSVTSSLQPQSEKSTGQKLGDSLTGNSNRGTENTFSSSNTNRTDDTLL